MMQTPEPTVGAFARVLIGLVRVYQRFLSPVMGHGCRFSPTCSHYMVEAITLHGASRGLYLGIRRLMRCHPWGGSGIDPVP